MKTPNYSISEEIFKRFPGYVRGVVIAEEVKNGPSPEALIQRLRTAEESVRGCLRLEAVAEEPRIKSWREAYRSFGAKPSEYRSSIEAMARRALRHEPLPTINRLVDIGNVISLEHLIPAGGHAIDVVNGDLSLRPAGGDETFVAFGSSQLEHPLPGEIIFAEEKIVLTRRWTWRQANHTLTLPETGAIEFNLDGLPPVPFLEIEQACQEIIELIRRFCGGRHRYELLSSANPGMCLKV